MNRESARQFLIRSFVVMTVCMLSGLLLHAQITVPTLNYNNQRTGVNLSETTLNQSNVNSGQFGKLFMLPVDDQVYAGILYVPHLFIAGSTHNVIFVATVNNSVYAFDADTDGFPLWFRNFNGSGRPTFHLDGVGANCGNYRDFQGNIGIVGTPVIDPSTGAMYFVTRTVESGKTFQRLHAIDILTGNERPNSPQVIQATFPGTGDNSDGTKVSFNPFTQNQRLGLALSQGVVYIGWSTFCDTRPVHGWIMAYDAASLAQVGVFNDTPNSGLGGFWQSGAAPAFDDSGNLYAGSGTGSFDGVSTFAETLLKLAPTSLNRLDFFTPSNWQFLLNVDDDFASTGPVMLPGTRLVVIGDKEGKLFVVNTDNLGKEAAGDTQIPQSFLATQPNTNGDGRLVIHGITPAWVGPQGLNIYSWGDNDLLRAFHFNPTTQKFDLPSTATSSFTAALGGDNGGLLEISANGSQAGTGVLWATAPRSSEANQSSAPGQLFAFNAENLSLLYTSNSPGDDPLNYAKTSPPLEVNGKVYVGSISNFVSVYGLKTTTPVVNNLALNRPATGSTPDGSCSAQAAFNGSAQEGPSDKWCSSVATPLLQVDLGANFNVSRFVLEHAGAGVGDPAANTRDFIVQVSLDGTNFETVLYVTGNVYSITTHDIVPTVARFVRLAVLAGSPATIYEFQVYGSPATTLGSDFIVAATPISQTATVGDVASFTTTIAPFGGFSGNVSLSISGLPAGVTSSFSPSSINGGGSSTLSINTTNATQFGTFPLTFTATSGNVTHRTVAFFTLNRNATGSVQVSAPAFYNVPGIKTDGTTFNDGGADFGGSAFSATQLGSSLTTQGVPFTFGPPDVLDAWNQPAIVPLPAGRFATLGVLAISVDGNSPGSVFSINYSDGTSQSIVQGVSDWFTPQNYPGESIALTMPYRNVFDGTKDMRPFNIYSYFFDINPAKTVSSIAIAGPLVEIYAMTLIPSHSTTPDFALSASPSSLSLTRKSMATSTITVTPLNGFSTRIDLSLSHLPRGISVHLDPDHNIAAAGSATLTITADNSAHVGRDFITITGAADPNDTQTHSINITLEIRAEASSPVQLDLSSQFVRTGITRDGSTFDPLGLDGNGLAYSFNVLGSALVFDGTLFNFGPPNAPDAIPAGNQTVALPAGKFAALEMIATGVNGDQPFGLTTPVIVNYSDGNSDSFAQGFSDWVASNPPDFPGEAVAKVVGPRNISNGTRGHRISKIYDYLFGINESKVATSIKLPNDNNVEVFAMTLNPDSCIYALNQIAANALSFVGPFDVNADCGVVVNSNSSSALNFAGTGKLTAENIRVVGGITQSPNATVSPVPSLGDLVQPDPFAFLTPPTPSTNCDFTNFTISSQDRNKKILRPGTYCNGITINGENEEGVVKFMPGTYILMGGGLKARGKVTLMGTGVTFFLTQGQGFTYGAVSLDRSVISTLKAPITGPMESILFFQDPAIGIGQPGSVLDGSPASAIDGVLYFPTTSLTYRVGGRGGDFLILVADTVTITGSVVLNNDFSELSKGSPTHRGRR